MSSSAARRTHRFAVAAQPCRTQASCAKRHIRSKRATGFGGSGVRISTGPAIIASGAVSA
jgi:hypothetical protein